MRGKYTNQAYLTHLVHKMIVNQNKKGMTSRIKYYLVFGVIYLLGERMLAMVQTKISVQGIGAAQAGELLKSLRKDRGYTLQVVADAVGCSPSYLHRLENSNRKNPSMKMGSKLAKFYEVDLSLLTGVEPGVSNTSDMLDLKSSLSEELDLASNKVKEGLLELSRDPDVSKQLFVDAQKSLLYMKSLI